MTRAYLAFTEKGLALAQKLAGALPGTVDRCGHGGPGLADWAAEQFAHADALIFVGAVGLHFCHDSEIKASFHFSRCSKNCKISFLLLASLLKQSVFVVCT